MFQGYPKITEKRMKRSGAHISIKCSTNKDDIKHKNAHRYGHGSNGEQTHT